MERIKRAKYAESCEKSNVAFMPIVLSTFGMSRADGTLFCNQLASAMRCSSEEEDASPNRRWQLPQQLQISFETRGCAHAAAGRSWAVVIVGERYR